MCRKLHSWSLAQLPHLFKQEKKPRTGSHGSCFVSGAFHRCGYRMRTCPQGRQRPRGGWRHINTVMGRETVLSFTCHQGVSAHGCQDPRGCMADNHSGKTSFFFPYYATVLKFRQCSMPIQRHGIIIPTIFTHRGRWTSSR